MAIIELFNECCYLRFKGFEHTFTEYSTGSVFNKAHQHAKHLLSASSDKKAALQDLMSEEPKNQLDCWHSPKLLFAKHIGYTKAFTELESIEPLKLSVFIRENTSPIDAYLTRDIGGYV
ncbi:hypothetical protein, partial [Vibrio sp. 10N.222.49.C9]|uniref:hypothetical protein n=1 Tax=Vibrio sp. 10N.222.49.C9 TaxID=3229615 RepID=UPI003553A08B